VRRVVSEWETPVSTGACDNPGARGVESHGLLVAQAAAERREREMAERRQRGGGGGGGVGARDAAEDERVRVWLEHRDDIGRHDCETLAVAARLLCLDLPADKCQPFFFVLGFCSFGGYAREWFVPSSIP